MNRQGSFHISRPIYLTHSIFPRTAVSAHVRPRTVRKPVRPTGVPVVKAIFYTWISGIDAGRVRTEEVVKATDRERNEKGIEIDVAFSLSLPSAFDIRIVYEYIPGVDIDLL